MKKFVYPIFALFLTIGCLDKTTDSQINRYLDHPLHGDNLKIHSNGDIDSDLIDGIFPTFDEYTFRSPKFCLISY